jgi:hypothetical protein
VDRCRQGDATRVGQSLEARGDVDAVAEDVVAGLDDVADVDPDAVADRRLQVGLLPRGLVARSAETALEKTASTPSPSRLTISPSCPEIARSTTSRSSACNLASVPSSSRFISRE